MVKKNTPAIRKYDLNKEKAKVLSLGYDAGMMYAGLVASTMNFERIEHNLSSYLATNRNVISTLLNQSHVLCIESEKVLKQLKENYQDNKIIKDLEGALKKFNKIHGNICEDYAYAVNAKRIDKG